MNGTMMSKQTRNALKKKIVHSIDRTLEVLGKAYCPEKICLRRYAAFGSNAFSFSFIVSSDSNSGLAISAITAKKKLKSEVTSNKHDYRSEKNYNV